MSEPYVRYAKRHLKRWSRSNLTVGNAESLPVPDESQDAVTSIFLFHELPPKVRRIVFREVLPGAEAWRASGPCRFAPVRRTELSRALLQELY